MKLNTEQFITLDLTVKRIKNIRCIENDLNTRTIYIQLTNNGEIYNLIKENVIIRYKIHKPDHTYIYNEIPNTDISDTSIITIILPDQAMTVAGVAHSELQISDSISGNIISTTPFNIIVEKSILSNTDIESKNESNVINSMINHLVDYKNPHRTTKNQVGLDRVDNTADFEKNVNSAKRLTFGRKINNTLFDGTKDIVTNKWGGKRNLTLSGDIEGSVELDGSEDINIQTTVKDKMIKGYYNSEDGKFYNEKTYQNYSGIVSYHDEITPEMNKLFTDIDNGYVYSCYVVENGLDFFNILDSMNYSWFITPGEIDAVNRNGDTMYGDLIIPNCKIIRNFVMPNKDSMIYGEEISGTKHNHALQIGHGGQDYWNFYEYGGVFNFYRSRDNNDTLLGRITENGWEGDASRSDGLQSFRDDMSRYNRGEYVIRSVFNNQENRFYLKCFNDNSDTGRHDMGVDYAVSALNDSDGRNIKDTYLALSGGTMSGNLYFDNGGAGSGIRKGGNDTYGLSKYNNLDLYSWYGISFSTTISGSPCSGKPAVSIDTRSGNMYVYDTLSAGNLKLRKGTSNYGSKLNFGDGDYVYLHEDRDDHLSIKSNKGIDLTLGGGSRLDYTVRTDAALEFFYHENIGRTTTTAVEKEGMPSSNEWTQNLHGEGAIFPSKLDKGYMYLVSIGPSYGFGFNSYNQNGSGCGSVMISGTDIHCKQIYTTSGDYAEYWEYLDENINNEDRVGHFVTFVGSKIRISTSDDPLSKIGVVSGSPAIIGDSDHPKEWKHKYLKDIYGRTLYDESGGLLLNPEFDPSKKYVQRKDRPEWDYVGTHGKLTVIDDGTCIVDSFCIPNDKGIATKSNNDSGFYVMERLDKSHIRIYIR